VKLNNDGRLSDLAITNTIHEEYFLESSIEFK
jgi:hypothetical protein